MERMNCTELLRSAVAQHGGRGYTERVADMIENLGVLEHLELTDNPAEDRIVIRRMAAQAKKVALDLIDPADMVLDGIADGRLVVIQSGVKEVCHE